VLNPSLGVALAALTKLLNQGLIKPDERTVVVSTAHGLKFAQAKVAYHSGESAVEAKYANPPVPVKENLGHVIDAIRTKFDW